MHSKVHSTLARPLELPGRQHSLLLLLLLLLLLVLLVLPRTWHELHSCTYPTGSCSMTFHPWPCVAAHNTLVAMPCRALG
jgi:hypothetical protein